MAEMTQLTRAQRRTIDEAVEDYKINAIDYDDLCRSIAEVIGSDDITTVEHIANAKIAR